MNTAFPFGSATKLVRALGRGELGAVELLKATLDRVDRYNPALNAIVVDDRERAFVQARAADRARRKGLSLGPLHGLPMTVKESFDLEGHQTTWGDPAQARNFAARDAVVVARLKAAGAVVFGKTNVPLWLADFQSTNRLYGRTRNPWDLARSPGGSSGGSAAALAAGLTMLEYGSDIGGSIRNPAAYCGVFGHKPSWQLVPQRGHALQREPIAATDLAVVGPLARSADDLALALKVTMGADDLTARGLRFSLPAAPRQLAGLRVAVWPDDPQAPVAAAVRSSIEAAAKALAEAGAQIDFGARPDIDTARAHQVYRQLLMAQMTLNRPDYRQLQAARAALSDSDQSPDAQFLRLATASFRDIAIAHSARERLRWAWHAFFQKFDVLLAPITCGSAFPHDDSEPPEARSMLIDGQPRPYFAQTFWAGLATLPLLPATAVPTGADAHGLPLALQVIGPEMGDLTTIWVAGQIARRSGGYRVPPGFSAR